MPVVQLWGGWDPWGARRPACRVVRTRRVSVILLWGDQDLWVPVVRLWGDRDPVSAHHPAVG